jgi:hypothetical protein
MNTSWAQIKEQVAEVVRPMAQNKKFQKRAAWGLGIFVVLQMYFVRELIAAELLFGLAFAFLFALASIFYVVGTIGERSFDLAEVGVRAVANSSRRGFAAIEEISKKLARHPHSESAR